MTEEILNRLFKCPGCKCVFFNNHDLQHHKSTFGPGKHEEEYNRLHRQIEHNNDQEDEHTWMPSKFGTNKHILLSSKDPRLSQAIRQQGRVRLGNYTYTFSSDQKWIIKEYVGGN